MAKDPAFLFYPNDYLGGTMGMTFEEKGAYMELLMLQFNRGHMTYHMMGQTVGQILDKVLVKFEKDAAGLYFNRRLEEEQNKRKSYVSSRINNKEGKNQYTNKGGHMTSHMENENRNENIDTNDLGKCENPFEKIPLDFKTLEAAEMNQFTMTKNRNTDFIKSQFEVFKLERSHDPPLKQEDYIKYPPRLYSHFLNWIRNKHPKTNGSNNHSNNGKPIPQKVSTGGFGKL